MSPSVDPGHWLGAAAPVLALFALVTSGKVRTRTASLLVAVLAVALATVVFGAGWSALGVAVGKGLWLGVWILYVVLPAMLLYRIAERAGLARIGGYVEHLFPNRSENLLVLAWLLPSFVQGVAGFGTPIAVAAPLLVASGWSRTRAVAYPLVGYHWSVTFGSMGSSFYVAALTSHVSDTVSFAHDAALLLGLNCLVAGALVLLLDGGLRGLRQGAPLLVVAGVPMVVTLYAVTSLVPAVGTVATGAVGLVCALALGAFTRRRGAATVPEPTAAPAAATRPAPAGWPGGSDASSAGGAQDHDPSETGPAARGPGTPGAEPDEQPSDTSGRRAGWLVSPYVYLLVSALAVLLVPASRDWVDGHLMFGPDFPATSTSAGWHTDAVTSYTPVRLLSHPGSYLLLACGLGYLTYRLTGLWRRRPARELLSAWFSSVQSTAVSILALACVTTVMIQSGMVAALARGAVAATGSAFPVLSAPVGAIGSFLTGSTTSSNALFASLQAEVAGLLHVPITVLLAAQTAGANVGNSVAPVVVLIGVSAVGGGVRAPQVLRLVLPAAAVLLVTVTLATLGLAAWSG